VRLTLWNSLGAFLTACLFLEMALEGLYWTHVEYFPMHFNCVSSDRVDELIGVFSHGQTGISVAFSLVFCAHFLQIA
jgi:hypothetical protein